MHGKRKYDFWFIKSAFIAFVFSVIFGIISSSVVKNVNVYLASVILLLIIFIGGIFDVVGIAVISAKEAPFHSMASRGSKIAGHAIYLIRNKGIVSNFCSDIIGDVCGVLSGAVAVVIAEYFYEITGSGEIFYLTLISSLAAALTTGFKAVSKMLAVSQNRKIIYYCAMLINFFKGRSVR